ncbi:hypothetical protein QAD02_006685 [Eretmocerus hayati]|uniref:Uncharacterized protein n=1 Tax=Eretmocerus hayati TaxID=131215 RepID=A0ACC2N207_9HYME|nr:hypothetical protein QAD02_006685 [Eretmocerus hayati]
MRTLQLCLLLRLLVPVLLFSLKIENRSWITKSRPERDAESDDSHSQEEDHEHGKSGASFRLPRLPKIGQENTRCAPGPDSHRSTSNYRTSQQSTRTKPPLCRDGYDSKPNSMRIANNGHSVQLTGEWPERDTPMIYGGPLTGIYQLAQIHFHWGGK